MLSDPFDPKIYLTNAQFQQRVLQSKSWARYIALPPIPPFDETAALAEIEKRNVTRSASQLPLLDVDKEVARLREHYESESCSDRFYSLAAECITEMVHLALPISTACQQLEASLHPSRI